MLVIVVGSSKFRGVFGSKLNFLSSSLLSPIVIVFRYFWNFVLRGSIIPPTNFFILSGVISASMGFIVSPNLIEKFKG